MTEFPLPTFNALMNSMAILCLLMGFRSVRKGLKTLHVRWMMGALFFSVLFLTSYCYYHVTHEHVKYMGEGFSRILYYFILMTHIPLAALMLPFILAALFFAWRGNFLSHKKITRWLWPVWLYVSVTGVLIYLFLYVLPT